MNPIADTSKPTGSFGKFYALSMLCLWLLGSGIFPDTTAARQLTEDEFAGLHQELQSQQQAWKTIPWQTSLVDGQRLAASEGKPLFIWAMDGHPLGCT